MSFFTIITVAFNPGEKIIDTLGSILSQKERDLRVIVKDAGSTDGSIEKARARFDDKRIKWVCARDKGIYDGMNQALKYVEAGDRLVYFLNCGDKLVDDKVLHKVKKKIESCASSRVPTIFYGDIIERRTGQRVCANRKLTPFALYRNFPNHQACFYQASIFTEDRFNARLRVRGDYEHFLRMAFIHRARLIHIDEVICDYEGGGYSETEKGRRISERERRAIAGRYYTRNQRILYEAYLILTLQPLRRLLAESPFTAGAYNWIRNSYLYLFRRSLNSYELFPLSS